MNRRTVVVGTAVAAAALFTGAALLYRPANETPLAASATPGSPPLIRPYSPVLGPPDAPVTIVEFFDPACEACRAMYPVVKQIMATYPDKVRVVLRYAALHATSEEAVVILEAARIQDRFEPVLERLLETQDVWAPHGRPAESAWTVLGGTGLDVDKAKQVVGMPGIVATMNQDAADVRAVGVRRTPTFFVNGKPLQEFGAQQLYDLVKSEVEAL